MHSQGSAAGGAALGQFWDSSGIGVLGCAPRTVLVPGEHPAVCLPDCSVFNNSLHKQRVASTEEGDLWSLLENGPASAHTETRHL